MKFIQTTILIAACLVASVGATTAFAETGAPSSQATASAKVGLFVRLDAKQGKEEEVAQFLLGGKAIVDAEPGTSTWFAIRLSPTTFGIFDTFLNEAGRDAHLAGKVAAALMAKAPDLLEHPPVIEKIDVLAVKLPSPTWRKNK